MAIHRLLQKFGFYFVITMRSLFFIAFISFTMNAVASDELDTLKKTFLAEAPKSWNLIKEQRMKGVDVRINMSIGSDRGSMSTLRVCLTKNKEFKEFTSPDEESTIGINGGYAFLIKRKAATDFWTLSNITTPDVAREHPQMLHGLLPASANLFDDIMITENWLDKLVFSQEFEITSIKYKQTDGNLSKDVELSFLSQFKVDQFHKVIKGTILFDPGRFWVIKEYDVSGEFLNSNLSANDNSTPQQPNETFRVRHLIDSQDVDGYPFPKRVKYYSFSSPEDYIVKDYVSVVFGIPDENLFRLSHYGFSEPSIPTQRGNTIRAVLVVISLLMIGLGLYLRFRASKV